AAVVASHDVPRVQGASGDGAVAALTKASEEELGSTPKKALRAARTAGQMQPR
ncbi:hypothetical protein HK405_000565, partial [Cladochytrium tenue]